MNFNKFIFIYIHKDIRFRMQYQLLYVNDFNVTLDHANQHLH